MATWPHQRAETMFASQRPLLDNRNNTCMVRKNITLFSSITVLSGTGGIMQNILHIQSECGECSVEYYQFHIILLWI